MPLLLLHGAGGTYLHWPPRLRRLPGRPVYAPDWPGHGRAPGPGLDRIEDFAALALDWLTSQGVERFAVAGHSLGGAVALQLALDHPDCVKAVIVVGGGATLPVSPALLAALQEDPLAATESITRWSYGPDVSAASRAKALEFLRKTSPETLFRAYTACSLFDVTQRLNELSAPLLIVAGDQDRMTPPSLAKELHAGVPGSTLHMLPNTGHMIPIEQPAALTRLVGDWLIGGLVDWRTR